MDVKELEDAFDEVLQCLTENEENDPHIDDAYSWFKKVIVYNLPYGKKFRGMTVLKTFKSLATPDQLTKENIYLCKILGWCVETYATFAVLTDDIVDQSETRRGKLCWYKKKEVGLQAVTDVLTLENATYVILRKYFRNKPCYMALLELFVEVTRHLLLGESLDFVSTAVNGREDYSLFTFPHFEEKATHMTSYYTAYLPVAAGMYFSGLSEETIKLVKPVLFKIGVYAQAENDYLDIYVGTGQSGKEGNDIQEGKCTYLILLALKFATDDQRNVLMNNYGKPDKESIAKVKAVYEELDMPSLFKNAQKEFYNEIETLIKDLPENISHDIFYNILTAYAGIKQWKTFQY